MIRGNASGPPKTVRRLVARPGAAGSSSNQLRTSAAKTDNAAAAVIRTQVLRFLDLPYELRLEIYEYLLLLRPEPIVVSPRRRQIHKRGGSRAGDRRPFVHVLRVCKQINAEGTAVLYGRNAFVVGQYHIPWRIPRPMTTSVGSNWRISPSRTTTSMYHAPSFFLWGVRKSTIAQLQKLTFKAGCDCGDWMNRRCVPYSTDGRSLLRAARVPPSFPNNIPLSPGLCREVFALTYNAVNELNMYLPGILSHRGGFW